MECAGRSAQRQHLVGSSKNERDEPPMRAPCAAVGKGCAEKRRTECEAGHEVIVPKATRGRVPDGGGAKRRTEAVVQGGLHCPVRNAIGRVAGAKKGREAGIR